jgi:hypothetical protein
MSRDAGWVLKSRMTAEYFVAGVRTGGTWYTGVRTGGAWYTVAPYCSMGRVFWTEADAQEARGRLDDPETWIVVPLADELLEQEARRR